VSESQFVRSIAQTIRDIDVINKVPEGEARVDGAIRFGHLVEAGSLPKLPKEFTSEAPATPLRESPAESRVHRYSFGDSRCERGVNKGG